MRKVEKIHQKYLCLEKTCSANLRSTSCPWAVMPALETLPPCRNSLHFGKNWDFRNAQKISCIHFKSQPTKSFVWRTISVCRRKRLQYKRKRPTSISASHHAHCLDSRLCLTWGRINGELFQSKLFWRVILMQIRWFKVMNFDSIQSQLSSNTWL